MSVNGLIPTSDSWSICPELVCTIGARGEPGEPGAGAMAAEGAETAPLKDGLMMVHDCLWLIMVHNINQNGSFMVFDCL